MIFADKNTSQVTAKFTFISEAMITLWLLQICNAGRAKIKKNYYDPAGHAASRRLAIAINILCEKQNIVNINQTNLILFIYIEGVLLFCFWTIIFSEF